MKTFRFILFWTLAGTMVWGCTKDSPGPDPSGERIAVHFAPVWIADQAVRSKAGQAAKLPQGSTVRIAAYLRNPSGSPADLTAGPPVGQASYAVTDDQGSLTPCTVLADGSIEHISAEEGLKLYRGTYDFYVLSPALPLDAADGYKATVPNGTDFAAAVKRNVAITGPQNNTVILPVMARKCSKINIAIRREEGYTTLTNLTVNSVTLPGRPSSGTYSPGAEDIVTGTAVSDYTPTLSFTGTLADVLLSDGKCYVLPQIAGKGLDMAFDLDMTIGGINSTKNLKGSIPDRELLPGKSYTVTLTLARSSGKLSAEEWVAGGDSDHDMGIPAPGLDYTDNQSPLFLIRPVGEGRMTYDEALAECPPGYRLPTAKELILAHVFERAYPSPLRDFDWYCWSTTADYYDPDEQVCLVGGKGTISSQAKTSLESVRCVRDPEGNKTTRYPYVTTNADGKKAVIVSRDENGGARVEALHDNLAGPLPEHYENEPLNSVSAKFEVSQTSYKSDYDHRYNYDDIDTDCAKLGDGWRGPSQREAMLISAMMDELTDVSPNVWIHAYHYTKTLQANTSWTAVWGIQMDMCGAAFLGTAAWDSYNILCIRDID